MDVLRHPGRLVVRLHAGQLGRMFRQPARLLLAGETARICCPEGYSCFDDTTTDSAVRWRKCITTVVDPLTTFVRTIDGTATVTTATPAMALAIQVRWQNSDLSIIEKNPTIPGATYMSKAPSPSDGSGASVDTGDGDKDDPPTAIIVVGVVVLVASLILGTIAFLHWRHHYRTKYRRTADNSNSTELLTVTEDEEQ
ncbi:uncharacterized protein PG998_014214 [Apiospora kogelbergensis]|uniref:uncharacterized protein n=1 Tax=Apiospora kogelbergensis TaxID=1337665 RepID=UPI00312F562D